jgi:hypothetical protein
MKIHIATSDKSSYILKAFEWLADKYIPEIEEIIVLGYSIFPNLSKRYTKVSLADKQDSPDEWSIRLLEYFNSIEDKQVIFGLDDFLPTKPFDYKIFNHAIKYMYDNNVKRYELGVGHSWHTHKHIKDDFVYEYGQDSLYRISTQFSVWDREYLIKRLLGKTNAWDFELQGSRDAISDGEIIIATYPYAWDWVQAGALSGRHPNKVNVLGIKREDVEEMISNGLLNRELLQLGMNVEANPIYV